MECNFENCGYYTDGECNICGMGISGEDTFCRLCKDNPNCYYKQNAELKAENDRLKEEIETRDNLVEHFRKEAINWAKISNDCIKDIGNYKQTLQEIMAIATECTTCGDCCNCKYCEDCDTDLEEQALGVCRMILDLITKAEEE